MACGPMTVTFVNLGTINAGVRWDLDAHFPCPGSFTFEDTYGDAFGVHFSPEDGLHGPAPYIFLPSNFRAVGALPFAPAPTYSQITYTPFNGSGFDPPVTIYFDPDGHQYIPTPAVNGGVQDLPQAQVGGSGCTADLPQS